MHFAFFAVFCLYFQHLWASYAKISIFLKSEHHEHHGACLGPNFVQNPRYVEVSKGEKSRRSCADDVGTT